MYRPILVATLAVAPFLVATAPAPVPPTPAPCDNLFVHEPVLVFESQGQTPIGAAEFTLTLYNDGRVTAAKRDLIADTSTIRTATVTHDQWSDLISDLSQGGAGQLCDVQSLTAIPTFRFSTLTILRDATDTKGHTFSWENEILAPGSTVSQRVWDFVGATFPGI